MGEIRKNKNDNVIDILDKDFSELDKANMIELLEEFPQKMSSQLFGKYRRDSLCLKEMPGSQSQSYRFNFRGQISSPCPRI